MAAIVKCTRYVKRLDIFNFLRQVEMCSLARLSHDDVKIRTAYSIMNYRDTLSTTGIQGKFPNFPHTGTGTKAKTNGLKIFNRQIQNWTTADLT